MCSPTLAVMAVSTAISAYGSYKQGKAEEAYYDYQASVAQKNAQISEANATTAEEEGREAELAKRRETAALISSQRTGYAGSNIDLGSDVVSETLADSAMLGELDALTIRSNAAKEAYNYRLTAQQYLDDANVYSSQGDLASDAGTLNAVSEVFGGAGDMYSTYKKTATSALDTDSLFTSSEAMTDDEWAAFLAKN